MDNLTIKERKIFEYLKESISQGITPSVREICEATSIKSTSTAHGCLKSLESKGFIQRIDGLNRCIQISEEYSPFLKATRVPVIGLVTAGMPILAVEEIEGYVPFDQGDRYSSEDLFALRIKGDSMIDAGILDDDIVIVHRTPVARNGEIIVALIEDEATVKTFYKEDGHFRLQPENSAYDPIIVDECSVLGKIVSLVRYF